MASKIRAVVQDQQIVEQIKREEARAAMLRCALAIAFVACLGYAYYLVAYAPTADSGAKPRATTAAELRPSNEEATSLSDDEIENPDSPAWARKTRVIGLPPSPAALARAEAASAADAASESEDKETPSTAQDTEAENSRPDPGEMELTGSGEREEEAGG